MDARAQRVAARLELPLMAAALLTIPAIVIDESTVGGTWRTVGTALNWTIWLAFLAETVVMTSVSERPGVWLRDHPLEVAIVVLTPPLLPAGLQAARVFRLLRLLRLVRGAMLARRLLSTEGVRDAAVFALVTVLGGGAAYSAVEKVDAAGHHLSAWDGVWWAVTTVTTVGYGDLSPHTDGGRVIAIVVMLAGIGFVAILTAAAAERFVRARQQETEGHRELMARLDEITLRLERIEARR